MSARTLANDALVLAEIRRAPASLTVAELVEAVSLSAAQVRASLKRLAASGEITLKTAKRYDSQAQYARSGWSSALFGGSGACVRRYLVATAAGGAR